MKKLKIAVVGANGKMGKLLCEKLNDKFDVLKITRECKLDKQNVCLVVDFASAESSVESAVWCAKYKVPLIVGSTGQTNFQKDEILKASEKTPILIAGNFSVGILLLKKLLKTVDFKLVEDIVIFEKHHKNKKDKPSGTALELENLIRSKTSRHADVLVERGGKEIGTHKIDLYFENELISIKHQAFSRECFADGVLLAVEFMFQQKERKLFS
ncbi:MAG: hypothetical protein J6A51_03305, partial [Clostridia bacterium]|nr:hypothetical protein [Clostridia bacterium]